MTLPAVPYGPPMRGTPIIDYGVNLLFPEEGYITTQLPEKCALIRIISILAFTALLAGIVQTTVFCWPVVLLGSGFAAWATCTHMMSEDPLMGVFYQIFRGERAFFRMVPTIQLPKPVPNPTLYTALQALNWDDLKFPISTTKTEDGREVVIVKAYSRSERERSILIYVQRAEPTDLSASRNSSLSSLFKTSVWALTAPLEGKAFEITIHDNKDYVINGWKTKICSSMTTAMANDLELYLWQHPELSGQQPEHFQQVFGEGRHDRG